MNGLSMPHLDVARARFWFTEAGWTRFGIAVVKDHEAAGLKVRVLREKDPPDSAVVYGDTCRSHCFPESPATLSSSLDRLVCGLSNRRTRRRPLLLLVPFVLGDRDRTAIRLGAVAPP